MDFTNPDVPRVNILQDFLYCTEVLKYGRASTPGGGGHGGWVELELKPAIMPVTPNWPSLLAGHSRLRGGCPLVLVT
jgi:hypothetical protein